MARHARPAQVTRSALREARFLAECSHCNIVALHEAFQSSSGRVYMVLEWAQHVLSQQLKSRKAGLPLVAVRSIIFQLLQALHYLHSRGIMHRGTRLPAMDAQRLALLPSDHCEWPSTVC